MQKLSIRSAEIIHNDYPAKKPENTYAYSEVVRVFAGMSQLDPAIVALIVGWQSGMDACDFAYLSGVQKTS